MKFKTAKLDKKRFKIIVKFPLSDMNTFRKVSQIKDSVMVGDHWELPANKQVISILKNLDFILSESLLDFGAVKKPEKVINATKIELPKDLKPYKYQLEGVDFIEYKNGRALIADEMGLGKTVQVLLWLAKHPELRPAVVVCPSSLKLNWQREIGKWIINSDPEILESTTPYKIKSKDILILNYEIIHAWGEVLKQMNARALILDEAHMVKNPSARRTRATKRLAKYVDNIVGLTGTPIENAPVEIYNVIQMIDSTIFPNYYAYLHKYCGAKRNPWGGLDTKGATNTLELHGILKNTIMIRRKKADVLKELPPKQIVHVPLSISNRIEYDKAEQEFISFVQQRYSRELNEQEIEKELKDFAKRNKIEVSEVLSDGEKIDLAEHKIERTSKSPAFPKLKMLEKLAAQGKVDGVINWIETFLESGEKLVVFAVHRAIVETLAKKFPESVVIIGGMNKNKKQESVDRFQNGPKVKLLVSNIQAGGVGLTLTASSNVAIIQFPWSPSVLNQAIDRVHRITQVHQVTVWMLIADQTIENRILEILNKKEKIITQVLDGKEFEDISVMMELVESYKQFKK